MRFPQARLLIFAKAPVPGRVKTRLIPALGADGATRLYRHLLRRTVAIATAATLCPVELWCAPDPRHSFFLACRRHYRLTLHRQQGADLGWRMHRALRDTLRHSRYAVLIGGDCPSLDVAALRTTLALLAAGQPAVLGPAADGGYVLIGLRRPCATLFRGIRWGSDGVLAATRRRLRRVGLEWAELAMGWDVDRPADVRRWRQEVSRNG